jgi:Carbamoyl-phosphate synthase L chain, ATP binding domain
MPHVVFIAPRFLENTNRFVRAFAGLDGVRLSVVSEDPAGNIPADLRGRIHGHYRVERSLDAAHLTPAVRALAKSHGPVDRLAGALEELQQPLADVRAALGIEGITPPVARAFREKDHMKSVLRAAGVPVAKSALVHTMKALRGFIDAVGYPVIIKPQAGLGARATHRVSSDEELDALKRSGGLDAPVLQVEEFVRAREHTCETVTVKGEVVWRSGTRYFPSPLEVLETPWVQYCVLLPREDPSEPWTSFAPVNTAALAALFGDAARTAAGTAITHMEWFLRDDGAMLVNEVGARPPGAQIMPLMNIGYEADLYARWAELTAFDRFTPLTRRWAAGAAFLRGQGGGTRVAEVQGVDRAVALCGDDLVELRAPKVGMPRSASYEGEGWAHVRSATTEGAKRALRAIIENVKVIYG